MIMMSNHKITDNLDLKPKKNVTIFAVSKHYFNKMLIGPFSDHNLSKLLKK